MDLNLSHPPERKATNVAAYQLVADSVSKEVVTALEELLASAQAGLITGIAFGAILKGRKYLVDCAGTAYADPTLARGVLLALDDELQIMVHSRTDRATTIF